MRGSDVEGGALCLSPPLAADRQWHRVTGPRWFVAMVRVRSLTDPLGYQRRVPLLEAVQQRRVLVISSCPGGAFSL